MTIRERFVAVLDRPRVAKGVQIGAAVLSFGLAILAHFVQSQVPADPSHSKIMASLNLAVFFPLAAGGLFTLISVLQWLVPHFVAPTGDQIAGDLLASVWSLPFSVPLAFVALDGTPSGSDWTGALLLVFAGVVFPAIRPRRKTRTPGAGVAGQNSSPLPPAPPLATD